MGLQQISLCERDGFRIRVLRNPWVEQRLSPERRQAHLVDLADEVEH